jgi:capsid protein
MLAMFIQKDEAKPGTLPIYNGAARVNSVTADPQVSGARTFDVASQIPGLVIEELQHGETPKGFGSEGIDLDYAAFEKAILQGVAWSNELPPEILLESFNSNYSASQAAINEFRIFLEKVWSAWGEEFCSPIYTAWLINETLLGSIPAPASSQENRLLTSWRDDTGYAVFGSWVSVDWYGNVKPSTDTLKQAKGSERLVSNAWSTNAKEARNLSGTKFTKNVKNIKRENTLLAEALEPLVAMKERMGGGDTANLEALSENVLDYLDETKEVN